MIFPELTATGARTLPHSHASRIMLIQRLLGSATRGITRQE
jgi:hypothetical protein